MSKAHKDMQITGVSEITINWKWVGIIAAILVLFTSGVGWMYMETALARPVNTHSGGY